jgi:hypothetical protein
LGSKSFPKKYPIQEGGKPVDIKNLIEDKEFKLNAMKLAMDKKGQTHIGGNKIFYIEELEEYNRSYP